MIKKTAFVFLFLLISFSVAFPSGFFNIGDFDGSTGVFFGSAYANGWRDIYLGEQDTILYSLRYINYDGFLGINISDYLAVYAIFGMDEFQFEENLDGDYNFKIGGGMRIKLIEFVKVALKSGTKESRTFNVAIVTDLKASYYSSSSFYIVDLSPVDVDWLEYQGVLAVSVEVDPLLFYLGGKVSFLEGNLTPAFFQETTFKNEGFLGLIIGGEVDITRKLRFGAELSVFEETYVSAFLHFQF